MAYVEVYKSGTLVAQRVVDDAVAKRGCRIRLGSANRIRIKLGQSGTVGKYEVHLKPGTPPSSDISAGKVLPDFSTLTEDPQREQLQNQYPEIDDYEIADRLGEGGMGTVWRAVQKSTQRSVALKFLHVRRFSSEKAQVRFEREVQLAARMEHPHIARIYDSGIHRGIFFYSMELIDGVPLDQYVHSNKLSDKEITELLLTICRAVQHAHERGVVHRDLKPSNILVDKNGQPHILDFGLAKTFLQADEGMMISVEGEIAGTPEYMSPEQAAGRPDQVDMRSDVYALGVIFFHLITGDWPHEHRGSRYDLIRRVVEEDVRSPSAIKKGIDREIEAILLKSLARDPDDRYLSAGDMADDLEAYLKDEPIIAHPLTTTTLIRRKLRKHRRAISIGCLVILLFGVTIAVGYAHIETIKEQMLRQLNALFPDMIDEPSNKKEEIKITGIAGAEPGAPIVYVNADANGLNDGSSWENAYIRLEDALDGIQGGEQIWVSKGVYVPSRGHGDHPWFRLGKEVAVYGGFTGLEANRSDRNPEVNCTVLSGDQNGDDSADSGNYRDNCTHVLHGIGSFLLDGFTVSGGNANFKVYGKINGSAGGLLVIGETTVVWLINCTFQDNSATECGGAVYLDHCLKATFVRCRFLSNRAMKSGGAIYSSHVYAPVLDRCLFEDNSADEMGGAVYNDHSDEAVISSTTFRSNRSSTDGGSIYDDHSKRATWIKSRFEHNTADASGGACYIYFCEDHVVDQSHFVENRANEGGAIEYSHLCTARVTRSFFSGNSATRIGGALHVYNKRLVLGNCYFAGNLAGSGGAFRAQHTEEVLVANSIFGGNQASRDGGAIAFSNPRIFQIGNCTFAANSAGRSAGGIALLDGGYISVSLSNSIFWGNHDSTGYGQDAQFMQWQRSPLQVATSCIQGWDGELEGESILSQNPHFRDPNGLDDQLGTLDDDLRLMPDSPCINAGSNMLLLGDIADLDHDGDLEEKIAYDLDGRGRVLDGQVDLGPYEHKEER